MAKVKAYLGIDTSCYTTSICLIDTNGKLLAEARQILKVKEGNRGLQQSEMVFQHTHNLPVLLKQIAFDNIELKGVGVSATPRPTAESYMPAFLVGLGFARSLAIVNKLPLYEISHQENHLEAGLWSAQGPQDDRFLLLHASGGTTDLLLAEKQADARFSLQPVGGSLDLHAGQFIDRLGVAMGLGFPCGPTLEKLAAAAKNAFVLPVSVNDCYTSLSGPASAALRALQKGASHAELALGAEIMLAASFSRIIINAAAKYNVNAVLIVGGVASNALIRTVMQENLQKTAIALWYPQAQYSADNASGCAAFAYKHGESHV